MSAVYKAQLFRDGASQAVRLPAEFHFGGSDVFISRDATTGDVTLSTRPGARAWAKFFDLAETVGDTDGYMDERPLNTVPAANGLFNDQTA